MGKSGNRKRRMTIAATAYETPTPEKLAIGKRMAQARHAAGISSTDAATAMGYSQPVQISQIENGKRPVTAAILVKASQLYGTTSDYLLGLTDDMDRDGAAMVHRALTNAIRAQLGAVVSGIEALSIDVARKLLPGAQSGYRLATSLLEVRSALARVQELNPDAFDDLRGGATLVSKVEVGASAATAYVDQMARAKRITSMTMQRAAEPVQAALNLMPATDVIEGSETA